jgi:3-oxoacyl-[acyl-carrier-protein] synthase II
LSNERDTAITGIGLVTSLGVGKKENWEAFCAGESGIRRLRGCDTTHFRTKIASQVPETFQEYLKGRFSSGLIRRTERFTHLGLGASDMAIEDAGLVLEDEDRERIAVVVGTGGGGLGAVVEDVRRAIRETGDPFFEDWARAKVGSRAVVKTMANSCAAQISISLDLRGPSLTVATACSSGAAAVCHAHDLLRQGRADAVLVGGTDALASPFALMAFGRLATLSERNDEPERASRPFDRERDGFVLGEGAAMMILETTERARRRGARIYAHLIGFAQTCEAHNIIAPRSGGVGMARTMELALQDAGARPEQVDYVNAHGTSTVANDACESQAIETVLGDHARSVWVSSLKSMIGHTVGAAGAIEAAVTALCIKEGVVPPTINYEHPDPCCRLDYVPNMARERSVDLALSNSFGFGGHNTTIVLSRDGRAGG